VQVVAGENVAGEGVDQRLQRRRLWLRPNRTGSRSPGSPRRGRRSRPDDRAADDRRTSTRRYEPIVPPRLARGRSRGLAPVPQPQCRKPGTTVSRECAGRPPLSRGQAFEPAWHVIEGLGHLVADFCAARRRNWDRCTVRDAANPLWADVPAAGAAPASAPRPRSGLLRRLPAMPSRAAPPGRSPAPRAPSRAARCRAPASPRNGQTRPAGNAPAGTSAGRSRHGRSVASCAIAAMMRFSAAGSSGRVSGVIGTPAVEQIRNPLSRLSQWLSQFAAVCRQTKFSRPAPAATFGAASANQSPRAA